MRLRLIKWYEKAFLFALSILGIATSCEDGPFKPGACEYGSPWAKFKVSGRVADKLSSQGIENIGIVASRKEIAADTVYKQDLDTVYTNKKGDYFMELNVFPQSDSIYLTFYDADGTASGHYQQKDTSVYFNADELVGGDDEWYGGETDEECNTYLEEYD